jgi:hypothetical protein
MKTGVRAVIFVFVLHFFLIGGVSDGASPGLPFTEDFSDTSLMDPSGTTANWSPEEEKVYLAWRRTHVNVFQPGDTGSDITSDVYDSTAVALGDMDGDGDLDVVAGNENQTNRLYLNNGTADPFNGVTGSDITADAHRTQAVALGDIDGDGDLDMVAGNTATQTNRLYLNNGTADPFNGVSGSDITADAHHTQAVALGDIDGDGDLDMVAGNTADQTNRLYLNNGTADPFNGVTGSDITTDSHSTRSIVAGDIDGDGDLDVVAGNINQTNRLYLNNGTADPFNAVTGSNITADAYDTRIIVLGDMDGDGHLDVVAGNFNQANRLYLNNGTADPFNGISGSDITTDTHYTWSMALGDVDGDGDLDVMAGNSNQTNRLYLNNGTTDPFNGVTGSDITTDSHHTRSIAAGDMDGDGDLDIIAANEYEIHRLYLNNGTTDPFEGVTGNNITTDVHFTHAIALGDMDGDGDLDVVVGNSTTQTNRLYLNNGTSDPFNGVTGTDITADAHRTYTIALGDMDGDGDLDVVAGNINQANRLYLNNGTVDPFNGITGSNISNDAYDTRSIVLGDLDGNGSLDMVSGNYNLTNRLYLNNGTGDPFSGVTGSDITADTHTTYAIALGDTDGDGDLDMVSGNNNQPNRLYLNNGTSAPFNGVAGSYITIDAHNTRAIALSDMDADGDLDVVVGNYAETNRLYLNNGTTDPFNGVTGSDITANAHDTWSVVIGDMDDDGDVDLVVGNDNAANRLYLNNGTADPFSGITGSDITTDANATYSIALGDVDGDGDLDVAAGNLYQIPYSDVNRLYLNNGTADPFNGVTGSDITADAHNTRAVALGDMDGDGDLDVVTGDYGQTNRLYLNNGTADPFSGVTGSDITADAHYTLAIALGDVDGDGDLDVAAGNSNQFNRLYLNNGTADPFSGVTGSDISADFHSTWSIALGDMDSDGDLDVAAGNYNQTNRLYLNNGTADPFNGVSGSNLTADTHSTAAIALGDMDSDGDLDVVAGNTISQANRLYLNNGTADPFNGVSGSNITNDLHSTYSIAVGDMDGDGDLDVVAGNYSQTNRLYFNNGTADPFNGVTGSDITADSHYTLTIALGDVDDDGDLDVVVGNYNQANHLYPNNGTANPFSGITGSDITADSQNTYAMALRDVDGDGDLDVVVGNYSQTNRLYKVGQLYNTAQGKVRSLEVDTETGDIYSARISPTFSAPPNTEIQWYLTNTGGSAWFIVRPGEAFIFPSPGSDLRWKADLSSLSPVLTPEITEVVIEEIADADGDLYDSVVVGGTDCDDENPSVNIAATEVCDLIDNDCDKLIDDADPGITGQITWYADGDSDTYGDGLTSLVACSPAGYVLDNTDCDDSDGTVHPGAAEVCDLSDNDCDGYLNNGVADCYMVSHLDEGFEYGSPADWTIVDNAGTSAVWRFDDPGGRGNLTGGAGSFAIADSDYYGFVNMDAELRTPVMDMSSDSSVFLWFSTDFLYAAGYGAEKADVDVSANGAAGPWTNVWHKEGADYRGPANEYIDISSIAGGASTVMVRFRYSDAYFDWWWQVDDVSILGRAGGSCAPRVWIEGDLYYDKLQLAYDDAVDQDTIMTQVTTLGEDIFFDTNKEVAIKAGSDCNYVSNTGTTTVTGDMAVSDGKVIIQDGTLALQ